MVVMYLVSLQHMVNNERELLLTFCIQSEQDQHHLHREPTDWHPFGRLRPDSYVPDTIIAVHLTPDIEIRLGPDLTKSVNIYPQSDSDLDYSHA